VNRYVLTVYSFAASWCECLHNPYFLLSGFRVCTQVCWVVPLVCAHLLQLFLDHFCCNWRFVSLIGWIMWFDGFGLCPPSILYFIYFILICIGCFQWFTICTPFGLKKLCWKFNEFCLRMNRLKESPFDIWVKQFFHILIIFCLNFELWRPFPLISWRLIKIKNCVSIFTSFIYFN
jgi:hypothetical protein